MKKTAPILLLSLLFSQAPSHGLVGGPFDNGLVPGQNPDGTYSAVMTGRNLTGTATFGIGSYEGFEGNGRFTVFHEGAVHYGSVSGTADLESKRVAGALLGVAALPTETTGGSATTTTAGQVLTVRSSAEGAFDARIKGYPQRLLFEGKGQLSSTANTAVTINGVTTADNIFLLLPAVPDSANQQTGTAGFITTATSSSAVVRSETNFKIRGSRTTTRAYNALNSFAAVPPLTPLVPTQAPTATPVNGTP